MHDLVQSAQYKLLGALPDIVAISALAYILASQFPAVAAILFYASDALAVAALIFPGNLKDWSPLQGRPHRSLVIASTCFSVGAAVVHFLAPGDASMACACIGVVPLLCRARETIPMTKVDRAVARR